jgi:mono/diheme cytochrome c family protein
MNRLRFLAGVIAGAALALPSLAQAPGPQASRDEIARGAYLVTLGDCTSCHTNQGEARFSGGRGLTTPFGVIYSANLTPDPETGIGRWTTDQFYRALHKGIRADGQYLYPALPYVYFTRISRADSDAIYAYLRTIPPARKSPPPNKLPFPFNLRALIGVWNALYFREGEFQPDPARSAEWNRGAWLVTGLGHCGDCHTPKTALGGDENRRALSGETLENWFAADLTATPRAGLSDWSTQDIVEFLKTGRNSRATASGIMKEVVEFSTSHFSDSDLNATAIFLKDQSPRGREKPVPAPSVAAMRAGGAIFVDVCTACHRSEGKGVPRFFPPLQANSSVQSRDAGTLVRIILEGSQSPVTDSQTTPLSMPAFGWKLNDQQIADVATYIRNSWGNQALPVEKTAVAKLRSQLAKAPAMPPMHVISAENQP